jgi:hypothetical protein
MWIGVISIPYFLLIANYAQWWGEWCPPGRYLASVLPLFALPFAVTLDRINGIAYRVIYGVLLFLSLLTMWGFIYQPQWMYNQPFTSDGSAGKSELLTKGFDTMGATLRLPFLRDLDLTEFLPSFVYPYFAYFRGENFGDAAAAGAWRTSLLPLAVVALVILVSLLLARASASRRKTPSGAPPNGSRPEEGPEPEREVPAGQLESAPVPAQNAATLTARESCAPTADLGKMGMVRISGRPFGLPGAVLKT